MSATDELIADGLVEVDLAEGAQLYDDVDMVADGRADLPPLKGWICAIYRDTKRMRIRKGKVPKPSERYVAEHEHRSVAITRREAEALQSEGAKLAQDPAQRAN